MNPFTRFLRQWLPDPDLNEFVERWDALERLIIRVYKGREASAADQEEYHTLRVWMDSHYDRFAPALQPYWSQARVAGAPAQEDPFRRLLCAESASAFVGDWNAMQHLPAAREAVNQLVLKQSEEE